MTPALAPVKIDPETDNLLTHASHFLGASKKDVLGQALREYVDNHRDEIHAGVREALTHLDGSTASAVSLLTGASAEEIERYGGLRES
ncbi:hypothetical protein [Ruania alba]|uniref:Uncharacterized protein n=1 Tax=Ruania alba TaxID=648782 RepID=A0A1H5GXZ8_9MICO|nr:hypothetical protein [Ruania alba]SEE20567.1 hypothetical protein SAMN04488554_1794 [Ruania alba]